MSPALLRARLKAPAFWAGQAFALGAVLAATMLRQLMSPLVDEEMPHIPYLLAVLVVSWRGGLGAGLTATLLSAVAANWVFVGGYGRFAVETDDLWATAFFVAFGAAMAAMAARLTGATRREAELASRLALVNGELQHRIKNIVALVLSVVAQSARTAASPEELKLKVEARLHAMSHALHLLDAGKEAVSLPTVVADVLRPFEFDGTIKRSGPEVSISGEVAVNLALVIHELATNAVKYGALSAANGLVELVWESTGVQTVLHWRETGGPRVAPPTRSGFGTRLLRATARQGEVHIEYLPSGVVCSVGLESRADGA